MTKSIAAALMLAAMPLALTACSGDKPAEETAAAGISGLKVTNARLVLPAVAGNPGAVYFDIANDGDRTLAIRNAEVSGAKRAEMHEMAEWDGKMVMGEMGPLTMQPGEKASFEPGGRHVMVFDLDPKFSGKPDETTEITLIVAGGDKATFPVTIQTAGEDR